MAELRLDVDTLIAAMVHDVVEDTAVTIAEIEIEFGDDGSERKQHELPFVHSMILPAFKGVDAVMDIDGLTNPRGFILIDEHQRNPSFTNIYAVGVCVAIPPVGPTPVPTGAPKTGYMIESMVTATAYGISWPVNRKAFSRIISAAINRSGMSVKVSSGNSGGPSGRASSSTALDDARLPLAEARLLAPVARPNKLLLRIRNDQST